MELLKYPRTHHIQGSRFQHGDEDLDDVPFSSIAGRHLVIEEKMDGANSAFSFNAEGKLLLQSRGHFLVGGEREKHFHLFKQWTSTHSRSFHDVLGSRYICYGEWLYAKHTVFYDQLPHFFLEFDIFDREKNVFLSTERRIELLAGLAVVSVTVLHSGKLKSHKELLSYLGPSKFISKNHLNNLKKQANRIGQKEELILKETDQSNYMEGLYIKVEEDGIVKERYKFVRESFLTAVHESETHWLNRPIIPNILQEGVSIHEN
jgi:hypothetical protein